MNFLEVPLQQLSYQECEKILDELKRQSTTLGLPQMLIGFTNDCAVTFCDRREELQFNLFIHFLKLSDFSSARTVFDSLIAQPKVSDSIVTTLCLELLYQLQKKGDWNSWSRQVVLSFSRLPSVDVGKMFYYLELPDNKTTPTSLKYAGNIFAYALEYIRVQAPDIHLKHFQTIAIASTSSLAEKTIFRRPGASQRRAPPCSLNYKHYAFSGYEQKSRTPDILIYKALNATVQYFQKGICVFGDDREIIGPASSRIVRAAELTAKPLLVEGTSALISDHHSSSDYSHWVLNGLSRILWIRNCLGNSIDQWIVKSDVSPFIAETLALLGISITQVISLERNPHLAVEELVCLGDTEANCCDPVQNVSPALVHHLRDALLQDLPFTGELKDCKLFISRADSETRSIEGEAELCDILCREFGFIEVVPSQLSVRDQIQLFQQATHVVGAHGAELTSILFCNPGTTVIEIFDLSYGTKTYASIAQSLGLNYLYVCGAPNDLPLSEENASSQYHCPNLKSQPFRIERSVIKSICMYLKREGIESTVICTEPQRQPIFEKAVQKSVQVLIGALANCPPNSRIGMYPETPEFLKGLIASELLRNGTSTLELIPLQGTMAEILVPPFNDFEYILPIANSRSQSELYLVIGPKILVKNVKEHVKHRVAIAENCEVLVWDKDFDLHREVVQRTRLKELRAATIPFVSRILSSDVDINADVKRYRDHIALYKDIVVQQVPSAIPFLVSLANKENVTTIIEIGTGNGGLAQAFIDYTNSKIITVDIENNASHLNQSADRVTTIVADAHLPEMPKRLAEMRSSGRLLLLIDGGDKSREFNHFKSILKADDLILVHNFAPSAKEFEQIKEAGTWLWHESSEDILNLEGLERFPGYDLFWKNYLWGVFYKTTSPKISLLLPTRGRPDNILRLHNSVQETADYPGEIEFIVAIDDDDTSYDELIKKGLSNTKFFKTPRTVLSVYWNMCYERASGEILQHCGDDLVFRTKGWDTTVKNTFEEYPDKIVFVFGNDGHWKDTFGTHGFIHRKWAETIGYFVPPYFSSDYNDTWLNDVAKAIGRHRYIDIYTEHMHPAFNKAEWDENHRERLTRHQLDKVDSLYHSKADERERDAGKLKRIIQ